MPSCACAHKPAPSINHELVPCIIWSILSCLQWFTILALHAHMYIACSNTLAQLTNPIAVGGGAGLSVTECHIWCYDLTSSCIMPCQVPQQLLFLNVANWTTVTIMLCYGDEDSYSSPWSTASISKSIGGLPPRQWEECMWSSDSKRVLLLSSCKWSDTNSDLEPSAMTTSPPQEAMTTGDLPRIFESPLRRNPQVSQAKIKFNPSSIVKDELGWQLSKVMKLNGCNPQCAISVHDLNEHILIVHAMFT